VFIPCVTGWIIHQYTRQQGGKSNIMLKMLDYWRFTLFDKPWNQPQMAAKE
jgi:hypothetical protein